MRLINSKALSKKITVPDILIDKLNILTNCDIYDDEVLLFNIALKAISEYIIDTKINLENYLPLNIFISDNNQITILSEKESILGCQFYAVFYSMNRLRLKPDGVKLFVIIEELAHYYTRIIDERIIKKEVEKIYKYINPDFTLEKYIKEYYND